MATRIAVTAIAAHLVAMALIVAIVVVEYLQLAGPTANGQLVDILHLDQIAGMVASVTSAAYIGAFVLLSITVSKAAALHGLPPRYVRQGWAFIAWRVAVVGTLVLTFVIKPGPILPDFGEMTLRQALLAVDRYRIVLLGGRTVLAALALVAAVVMVRRVQALVLRAPSAADPSAARIGLAASYRLWRDRRQARVYE